MNLRGFYNHKYELNEISGNSLIILTSSADRDIDHSNSPINAWDFIKNSFYREKTLKYLMGYQDYPIIGKICKNMMFSYISIAYDVTTTFM